MGALGLAGMAACVQVEAAPTATEVPTATEAPTATIEWFPATATATLVPTLEYTATPDLRPGRGELLLEDDFSDEDIWQPMGGLAGSATVLDGHLTLALPEGEGFFYVERTGFSAGDFVLEVEASANLCRGADEYGLLIRTTPEGQYYRYSVSCDGRARLDRFFEGQIATLAPWTANGVIPRAVPSTVRLGVWANGEEVRFFVNDQFLFSIRDSLFYQGGVGVFVRKVGETPVTVHFSALRVWGLEGE